MFPSQDVLDKIVNQIKDKTPTRSPEKPKPQIVRKSVADYQTTAGAPDKLYPVYCIDDSGNILGTIDGILDVFTQGQLEIWLEVRCNNRLAKSMCGVILFDDNECIDFVGRLEKVWDDRGTGIFCCIAVRGDIDEWPKERILQTKKYAIVFIPNIPHDRIHDEINLAMMVGDYPGGPNYKGI